MALWWSLVSIEPAVFLFYLSATLQVFTTQSLLLQRTCSMSYGFDQVVCSNLSSNATIHNIVQSETTYLMTYMSVLDGLPAIFLTLLIGPWSDHFGTNIPIMYNMLMMTANAIFLTAFSYQTDWPPIVILIASALRGLSGNMTIFNMASFSHISKISSEHSRSFRIGIIEAHMFCGLALGMVLSGILVSLYGYVIVFASSAVALMTGFLYIVARMGIAQSASTNADVKLLSYMKTTCTIVWNRDTYVKKNLLILGVATAISAVCVNAEINVYYLYTDRKFQWSISLFTIVTALLLICRSVETSLILAVFNRYLGISDFIIGAFGSFLFVFALIIMALTSNSWVYALSLLLLGSPNASSPIIRSLISKCVHPHELGHVFSIFASIEAAMPLVCTPIILYIYRATLSTLPGTTFLCVAGLQLLIFIMFLWMYKDARRSRQPNISYDATEALPILS